MRRVNVDERGLFCGGVSDPQTSHPEARRNGFYCLHVVCGIFSADLVDDNINRNVGAIPKPRCRLWFFFRIVATFARCSGRSP